MFKEHSNLSDFKMSKSIFSKLHADSPNITVNWGERGGSVVECRTPEREVRGSRPISAVLCPWARHFTPRKYWLITQEAMAPSRHDWKIVDWDVKPQHNQPTVNWLSQQNEETAKVQQASVTHTGGPRERNSWAVSYWLTEDLVPERHKCFPAHHPHFSRNSVPRANGCPRVCATDAKNKCLALVTYRKNVKINYKN